MRFSIIFRSFFFKQFLAFNIVVHELCEHSSNLLFRVFMRKKCTSMQFALLLFLIPLSMHGCISLPFFSYSDNIHLSFWIKYIVIFMFLSIFENNMYLGNVSSCMRHVVYVVRCSQTIWIYSEFWVLLSNHLLLFVFGVSVRISSISI